MVASRKTKNSVNSTCPNHWIGYYTGRWMQKRGMRKREKRSYRWQEEQKRHLPILLVGVSLSLRGLACLIAFIRLFMGPPGPPPGGPPPPPVLPGPPGPPGCPGTCGKRGKSGRREMAVMKKWTSQESHIWHIRQFYATRCWAVYAWRVKTTM